MSEKIDIKHISKLSRLELTEEELVKYGQQLTGILGYVEKLGEFRSSNKNSSSSEATRLTSEESIQPPRRCMKNEFLSLGVGIINGVTDVMREDEVGDSLPRDEALKNTPTQKDGFIQVKGVFAEGEQ